MTDAYLPPLPHYSHRQHRQGQMVQQDLELLYDLHLQDYQLHRVHQLHHLILFVLLVLGCPEILSDHDLLVNHRDLNVNKSIAIIRNHVITQTLHKVLIKCFIFASLRGAMISLFNVKVFKHYSINATTTFQ